MLTTNPAKPSSITMKHIGVKRPDLRKHSCYLLDCWVQQTIQTVLTAQQL